MKITNKKDLKQLEKRRLKGIRLLERGYSCYRIAKELGVRKQSVMRWRDKYELEGIEGVKWNGINGRPSKLTNMEKRKLKQIIPKGPTSYGYPNELWTTVRITDVIRKEFKVKYHQDSVGVLLHQLGFSYQKPKKRALERNESAIRTWKTVTWPDLKKSPDKSAENHVFR